MAKTDLTIIFLTANKLPKQWVEFQKQKLLEAAADNPIITISRKPLDWGINVLQTEPHGASNVYWQLLKGAKLATTEFIAVAEDDTLYPAQHFSYRPPSSDAFYYNRNKFGLFTWGKPTYYWKDRFKNSTLVASRKLVMEALTERFTKYPKGTPEALTGEMGRSVVENNLGLARQKAIWFETEASVVCLDHAYGIDPLGRTRRKALGALRAYDIPYWGKAEDIVKKFV